MKNGNMRSRGIIMVLLGGILWGASGTAVQFLFQEKLLSPEWLLLMRMSISGFLLIAWDFFKHGDIFAPWRSPKYRWQLVIYGVLGMVMTQYSYFLAIEYGNSATATVLQYLMPIIVLGFTLLRFRRRPTAVELLSVFLAVVGTFLLITKGHYNQLAISPGTLFWGIFSAFAMAFYTMYPRKLLVEFRSALVIGWSMLVGSVFTCLFLHPFPFRGIFDWGTAGGMTVLILLGTIVAFSCYLESTKYIRASEVASLASVEPLASVVLAVLVMHVDFGAVEVVGVACIISTVFLLARQK